MNTQSKIFFVVLFLLILGSVFFSYYKFVLVRDYFITAQAECDPVLEICFTHICDPEADEECTGNPEEDTSYYKLIRRNAMYMPVCDPAAEGCAALTCPVGEEGCEVTLCDEETLAETEENASCNDPEEYVLNHPAGEEEEITEGGDTVDEVSEEGGETTEENGEMMEDQSAVPEKAAGEAVTPPIGE